MGQLTDANQVPHNLSMYRLIVAIDYMYALRVYPQFWYLVKVRPSEGHLQSLLWLQFTQGDV
jgi:hypothetical protein